ncbi:MAG: hypothetical protein WD009_04435 [Phycisphaeraceae bacterium]
MRLLTLLGIVLLGLLLTAMHTLVAFALVIAMAANVDGGEGGDGGGGGDSQTVVEAQPAGDDADADAADADVDLPELAHRLGIDGRGAGIILRPIQFSIDRPYRDDLVVFETPWWVVLYWLGGMVALVLGALLCAVGIWRLGGRRRPFAVTAGTGGSTPPPR